MPKPPETWVPSAASRPPVGTLIYFEFRARGEPPNLIAAYIGLHLRNARLPFSEYHWMVRTLPGGVCPALELDDGSLMGETQDISRHLASKASPIGRAPLVVDATQDAVFEMSNTPPISHARSNPLNIHWLLNMFEREKGFAQLPAYLAAVGPSFEQLEARLAAAPGGGPFFSGARAGYGDLGLLAVVDNIDAMAPGFAARVGPRLATWFDACLALPGIAEYMAARPQIGAGSLGNPGSVMAIGVGDAHGRGN